MSDCSTEAMNPKDETCGTCSNECIHAGSDTGTQWCIHYIPDYDTLEQRYQQLEQVAREMFVYISGKAMYSAPVHWFHDKLEAVGVSLDD